MTMPLIVAIEPDRGQANQLKAMVRAKLRAELVLADTAAAALKALGDRVPDLVLTSAFLSPRDEAALAERLRTLEAAASHVQTLTIPVLDAPKPAHSGRGVLSSLLRDRANSAAPDGCDPAVFAEQCAAYLERAASERATQVVVHDDTVEQQAAVVDPIETAPQAAMMTTPEQPTGHGFEKLLEEEKAVEVAPGAEHKQAVEFDLSALLDETVVHELSAAIENVTAAQPRRPSMPKAESGAGKWTPVPVAPKTQSPEMEALWAEPSEAPAPAASARPARQEPRASAVPPIARASKAAAVKDDWGLFDPAQCGFATLLAKFDEVTQVAPPLPTESASAGPLGVSR
jgi:hypothetical protein